jgi:hypothetical protein
MIKVISVGIGFFEKGRKETEKIKVRRWRNQEEKSREPTKKSR